MSVQFVANPRNGLADDGFSPCASRCCCEQVNIVPGETNRWYINYASWLAGLGGRGLVTPVDINISRLMPEYVLSAPNATPPTNLDYDFAVMNDATLNDSVATNATMPEGVTLTYAMRQGSGPYHGIASLSQTGGLTYRSNQNFVGIDSFEFSTSDGINPPLVNRAIIAVSSATKTVSIVSSEKLLEVPLSRIAVQSPLLTFALVADQQIRVGDVYRMTIRQAALDCDASYFYHTSCYDLSVVKC